jgi:hypothetical protein
MAKLDIPRCSCGTQHLEFLVVPDAQLEAYRQGALIQEAFPSLTVEEREMLLTGMNQACWDRMISEDVR